MPRPFRIVSILVYGLCAFQSYSSWERTSWQSDYDVLVALGEQQGRFLSLNHDNSSSGGGTSNEMAALGNVVVYVPRQGPDAHLKQQVVSAIAPNDHDGRGRMEQQITASQGITSQVLVHIPTNNGKPWTLQALDESGHPKTVGGDEFYVTFTSSSSSSQDSKLWNEEPNHPTAVALITDQHDGTYVLDFVRSPMAPESNSHVDNSLVVVAGGGTLTIHFVYTAGMGEMPPPTKESWKHGGAIQASYSFTVVMTPRIRPFQPPARTVDLATFDHVLLVGDSLMAQFCGHAGTKFRPHVTREQRTAALNTQTVQSFVDKTMGAARRLIQQDASLRKLVVILGSSTWDILADDMGQGVDFNDHGRAVRMLITQVRKELGQLGLPSPPLVVWKSATAVHAHVVVDKGTRYFGTPAKARKRIKYMSSSRSATIYKLQKEIMKEMQVPMLDVYEATLLSGDWHFPTDGRHFRPEFNEMTFNWFYSTKENIDIDYRFDGYGVEFLDEEATSQT